MPVRLADRIASDILGRFVGPGPDVVGADVGGAQSLLAAGPGVATTSVGIALFAGAAAAAVSAAEWLGRRPRANATNALAARVQRRPAGAWSGFLPVGRGWISVALASRSEQALAEDCVAVCLGDRLRLDDLGSVDADPVALASALQEWGVAAAPARAVSGEAIPPSARFVPTRQTSAALAGWLQKIGFEPSSALRGVRVVDCGHVVSSPWAAALLAHLGANVVSIAHPARTGARRYGGFARPLDLREVADREGFARLCRGADLVLDNFRPRVWPNLGLDPIELGAHAHVSLPAYEERDPRSNHRLYGFQLESQYRIGHAPDGSSVRLLTAPHAALLDHAVGFAGAVAAIGGLAASDPARVSVSHHALIGLASCASDAA